jgi:hypothetical protein
MPGMSLLSPSAGREYLKRSKPNESFSVTWMHRRGVYSEMANAAGLELKFINGSRVNSEKIISELEVEIKKTENVVLELQKNLNYPLDLIVEAATDAIETCKSALKIVSEQKNNSSKSFLLAELEREFLETIWFMQATIRVPISE